MSYASARVGSVTKGGDDIITGSNTVFLDPSPSVNVTTSFNGQTIVYNESDLARTNADDPESDTGVVIFPPLAPGQTPTPQQLAASASNSYTATPTATAVLAANNTTPLPSDCNQITGLVPYSYQLSTNFTLNDLSQGAVLSRAQIQAQHGLTVAQIVCNLKGLAINPLESLAAKYGRNNLLITSGFRPPHASPNSSGTPSQHELGQAADVQIPSFSSDQFWAAAQWVQANVNYDQFILEIAGPISAGHRPWLHLSFNRNGNRKKVNTCTGPGQYPSGLLRIF